MNVDAIYTDIGSFPKEEATNNILPFRTFYPEEDKKKATDLCAPILYKENYNPIKATNYRSEEEKSEKAIKIIRTFYTKKIIKSLAWLAENHESTIDSISSIQEILETSKKYFEEHFEDPYSSFLSALYDSLSFNDCWIKLEKPAFSAITKIITNLNNQSNLTYEKIDRNINELEKLGLDTTPY
jgi:hypothetical protein